MPSSVAPKISWHQVTLYSTAADGTESEALTTPYDFSVWTVQDNTVDTSTIRFRIKNDNGCADAINPIIYLAGTDSSKLSTEESIKLKVVSDNGTPVVDTFETITDNSADTKELHSNIESGTYIGFDTYVSIPAQTRAGRYAWQLVLEYEYTV